MSLSANPLLRTFVSAAVIATGIVATGVAAGPAQATTSDLATTFTAARNNGVFVKKAGITAAGGGGGLACGNGTGTGGPEVDALITFMAPATDSVIGYPGGQGGSVDCSDPDTRIIGGAAGLDSDPNGDWSGGTGGSGSHGDGTAAAGGGGGAGTMIYLNSSAVIFAAGAGGDGGNVADSSNIQATAATAAQNLPVAEIRIRRMAGPVPRAVAEQEAAAGRLDTTKCPEPTAMMQPAPAVPKVAAAEVERALSDKRQRKQAQLAAVTGPAVAEAAQGRPTSTSVAPVFRTPTTHQPLVLPLAPRTSTTSTSPLAISVRQLSAAPIPAQHSPPTLAGGPG